MTIVQSSSKKCYSGERGEGDEGSEGVWGEGEAAHPCSRATDSSGARLDRHHQRLAGQRHNLALCSLVPDLPHLEFLITSSLSTKSLFCDQKLDVFSDLLSF